MSVILTVVGVAITFCSVWLMFHLSDKRVLRRLRPRWNPKMSKSETEEYRQVNTALLAMVLMVMGSILLLAGVLRLFGIGS
jgi:uncharacterized membrane protein